MAGISKQKEFRKNLAEMFAKVLEEKELDWKKGWKGLSDRPVNAARGYPYRSLNEFVLQIIALERGYTDPRWATYNQIQQMGYKLKDAKEMGVRVEFWYPYDKEERKALSWEEFKRRKASFREERYIPLAKYSTVFNAAHIEGLPERVQPQINEVEPDELIHILSENMGVEILNDGGDRAFYRPKEDKIHLPLPEAFNSSEDYNATALHELAHSTGAAHRLNRKLGNGFGSPEYAFEELIAEISSCFMTASLNGEPSAFQIENHKAYVQSWAALIREDPEALVRAIAEAEKAAAYMDYKAGLVPEFAYEHPEVLPDVKEEAVYTKKETALNERLQLPNISSFSMDSVSQNEEVASKTFSDDIDRVLENKMISSDLVKARDYTPDILVKNGVRNLPMLLKQSHVRSIIYSEAEAKELGIIVDERTHYHGLGKELLVDAIESMDNPLAVYKDENGDYLVITELIDKEGNQIVVPIKVDSMGTYNNVYLDENRIKSVYGRKNLDNYIAKKNLKTIYEKNGSALNEGRYLQTLANPSKESIPQNEEMASEISKKDEIC